MKRMEKKKEGQTFFSSFMLQHCLLQFHPGIRTLLVFEGAGFICRPESVFQIQQSRTFKSGVIFLLEEDFIPDD